MTTPSPGGLARRATVLCALAVLAVAGGGAAEAKQPPAIVLSPNSGTPGSTVVVRGTGFCGAPGCTMVDVLFAGVPAAEDVAVGRDGTFRGTFRVPGGGVVGATNVTATQTGADGYEIRAFAQFDLVFGQGEEAEVQAEINDLVARPSDAVLSQGPPRGVPFESLAAGAGSGGTSAPATARESRSLVRAAGGAVARRWPLAAAGVAAAAAGAWAARRWLRRPLAR